MKETETTNQETEVEIGDFGPVYIPIIVQFGSIKESDSKEEFLFESNYYRIVVEKRFRGHEKKWVLTAFELRKRG